MGLSNKIVMTAGMMIAAALASCATGGKLTGSELQTLIAPGVSISGIFKERTGFTIRHFSNGRALVTWNSDTETGSDTGTWRILGDTSCKQWDSLFDGIERCWLIYKTGDNEYWSYRDDVPVATWSVVE